LESEVFLLGQWKNFDELESSLSLEELTALLEISRKKSYEDKKFLAAVNGVELEDEVEEEDSDILELQGYAASREGFGIDQGLGAITMGEDE